LQDTNVPTKIGTVWAASATAPYINPIPVPSQPTNGRASFTDGFPPNCFIPLASGGAGPFGSDTNGILQLITQWLQWEQAGGPISYDSVFSTAIGGYPKGAMLDSVGMTGLTWISSVDNNTGNPDSGTANWLVALLAGDYFLDVGVQNLLQTNPPAGVTFPAPYAGLRVSVRALFGNTGAAQFNWMETGALPIIYSNGAALTGNDYQTGAIVDLVFNGFDWQLASRAPVPSFGGVVTLLTAATTFYVATTGSDTTGTGTSSSPWATIQHAYNTLQASYDAGGNTITVSVADGTYTTGLIASGSIPGQTGSSTGIVFVGSINAIINVATSNSPLGAWATAQSFCFMGIGGANFTIQGFTLQNSFTGGTGAACVCATRDSTIYLNGTHFGAVLHATFGAHILSVTGGLVFPNGNYTVTGSAIYHWYSTGSGAQCTVLSTATVTFTGSPSFSYLGYTFTGSLYLVGVTLSGAFTATVSTYSANARGVIIEPNGTQLLG